jgi:hypothetical protein
LGIWAGGEACASLGFKAARLLDQIEALRSSGARPDLVTLESEASVLATACKMWSAGDGSRLMREAVGLMGGSGLTEDCPGDVGNKWIDSQREAIDEYPQGMRLGTAMANELFLARFRAWIPDLQALAVTHPRLGADVLVIAMEVWLWTFDRLRHTVLAEALCGILASRAQMLDVAKLAGDSEVPAKFLADLCHIQAINVIGEVSRVCAELVYGGGDGSAGLAFADMWILLDGALAGSAAVRDRAMLSVASHQF